MQAHHRPTRPRPGPRPRLLGRLDEPRVHDRDHRAARGRGCRLRPPRREPRPRRPLRRLRLRRRRRPGRLGRLRPGRRRHGGRPLDGRRLRRPALPEGRRRALSPLGRRERLRQPPVPRAEGRERREGHRRARAPRRARRPAALRPRRPRGLRGRRRPLAARRPRRPRGRDQGHQAGPLRGEGVALACERRRLHRRPSRLRQGGGGEDRGAQARLVRARKRRPHRARPQGRARRPDRRGRLRRTLPPRHGRRVPGHRRQAARAHPPAIRRGCAAPHDGRRRPAVDLPLPRRGRHRHEPQGREPAQGEPRRARGQLPQPRRRARPRRPRLRGRGRRPRRLHAPRRQPQAHRLLPGARPAPHRRRAHARTVLCRRTLEGPVRRRRRDGRRPPRRLPRPRREPLGHGASARLLHARLLLHQRPQVPRPRVRRERRLDLHERDRGPRRGGTPARARQPQGHALRPLPAALERDVRPRRQRLRPARHPSPAHARRADHAHDRPRPRDPRALRGRRAVAAPGARPRGHGAGEKRDAPHARRRRVPAGHPRVGLALAPRA